MTAPTPPTCTLWIDGARYADGSTSGETDTDPVALTGLRVTWGRDSTIDQPEPATCTVDILDRPGGTRAADTIRVGSRLQVRADAVIYPDPTVPTLTDPGFEAATPGATPPVITTNAAAVTVLAGAAAHTGAQCVRVTPANPGRAVRVIFPPAPFTPTDPAGWDTVPRTMPGQSWTFGAAVHLPTALAAVAAAAVHPVAFSQPWPGSEHVLTDTAAAGPPDPAGWAVHTGPVLPPAGVWLGVAVDIYPTGPRWADVPPTLTWDQVDPSITWDSLAHTLIDDLVVLAPAAGAARSGEVFTGRVTDLTAQWDGDAGGTVVTVTAQDDTAELANRYVGAEPWAVEALSARFTRILTAAGQVMTARVDPVPGALSVTYRDVDNQAAGALLAGLAQSAGGVLWSATSLTTGPYLWLEDMAARPPLLTLAMDADGVIRLVPVAVPGGHGVLISACDVLLDPVQWVQDVGDTATRVALGWKDQAPDPVKPTDRTITVIDTAAEAASGQRRVQIATELAAAADAQTVAAAVLGRLSVGGWRIRGLTYRVDPADPVDADTLDMIMTVLDATTRVGLPIVLTDVPAWSPTPTTANVPLYLEGAQLTNDDGAWTLELITASARNVGAGTLRWQDVPADWSWNEFDPTIRWADLAGVGPPGT